VLGREGDPIMRALGTYFEQVPRTVIEKILAQQNPPPKNEVDSDEAIQNWAITKPKTRHPKS
jgi:hypothetical protein